MTSRPLAQATVCSASSYSGSVQVAGERATYATRAGPEPSPISASSTAAESCQPRNGSAPCDGCNGSGAERQNEHVIGHPVTALRDRRVGGGVDALQGVAPQVEATVVGDSRELGTNRPVRLQRCADRERPVDEVALRRKHLDVEPVRCERLQRQDRFEACDAAAGDEDLRVLFADIPANLGSRNTQGSGLHTSVGPGKPAVRGEGRPRIGP